MAPNDYSNNPNAQLPGMLPGIIPGMAPGMNPGFGMAPDYRQVPGQLNVPFDVPGRPMGQPITPNVGGMVPNVDFSRIQEVAQRLTSPYTSFGPRGFLQDRFPGLSRVLDNVFLAAANTPGPRGPEGAGAGISRAFQGLVGARQMGYERQLQQQLLPVELAQRQFAFQKNYLDVLKDQAQINQSQAAGYMDWQRGANFARLADTSTSPYSAQRVGTDGFLYGTRKDTGREELVPGQPGLEGGIPIPGAKGSFMAPGMAGRNPTIVSLAADVANGIPGAQERLRTAINAQAQAAGAGQGARDVAGQPKQTYEEFYKGEQAKTGAMLGKRPDPADQKVFESAETMRQIMGTGQYDPTRIPTLQQRQTEWDAKAQDVKGRFSRWTKDKSRAGARSLTPFDPSQDYNTLAPQAAPQAAPRANVPGAVPPAQRSTNPNDPMNILGNR